MLDRGSSMENGSNSTQRLGFRPVSLPQDEAFLKRLYGSTRDDLAQIPLPDLQKETLIEMQYEAQRRQYLIDFPEARHDILLLNNEPAGRLMVNEESDSHRIIDLAILPEHRGMGVGESVIRAEQERACRAQKPLRLQVLVTNRAARLYERTGFKIIDSSQTHHVMEWTATEAEHVR